MSYLVLARKWRPKGFDDLVGQDPIKQILENAISQDRIAHAYLFSGPRGVGKTSTARILSKAMNCEQGPTPSPCGVCRSCVGIAEGSSVDVIEIDGASNNSVDDIRDLREKVKYAPSSSKYKLYIIDEVHMLSGSAFNALLKTLEEPPSHVIFVLATTALRKIPATILSRCQHMPFRRITSNEIKTRLALIAEAEGIKASPDALSLIARAADGSMRDALTILDQIFSFTAEISEENVKTLLGMTEIDMLARIAKAIIRGDRVEILEVTNLLSEQGTDSKTFAKELVQFFRDLLVMSVMNNPEGVLDLSSEERALVSDIVAVSSEDQLTLMLSELMKAEAEVRNSSSPRLALEMAFVKTSFLSTMKPLKHIIENIERFSEQLGKGDQGVPVEKGDSVEQPVPMEKKTVVSSETDRTGKDPAESKRRIDRPAKVSPQNKTVEETPETQEYTVLSHDTQDEESSSPVKQKDDNDILTAWKRTLERIDPPLASKISKAAVELNGNELVLTLNGGVGLFEDAIRNKLNDLEQILSEESGKTIKIKLTSAAKKSSRKKDLKNKVMNEPIVKEAMELFDGRVVNITPLNDPD
jgi:DNA polymerase-3 subunit gamma/tau